MKGMGRVAYYQVGMIMYVLWLKPFSAEHVIQDLTLKLGRDFHPMQEPELFAPLIATCSSVTPDPEPYAA